MCTNHLEIFAICKLRLTEEELKYVKSCTPPLHSNIKGCYDITKFPRGIASVINVEHFIKTSKHPRRLGTDYDADQVTSVRIFLEAFLIE